MGLKVRQMHWLIGRKSPASLENKLLIYKAIIKPIGPYIYGIELWGWSCKSNVNFTLRFQSKLLRIITPWYISNKTLHKDLRVPYLESHQNKKQHPRWKISIAPQSDRLPTHLSGFPKEEVCIEDGPRTSTILNNNNYTIYSFLFFIFLSSLIGDYLESFCIYFAKKIGSQKYPVGICILYGISD